MNVDGKRQKAMTTGIQIYKAKTCTGDNIGTIIKEEPTVRGLYPKEGYDECET